jgi:hypothetical protein
MKEITAQERAGVMRMVMAMVELQIPEGAQDALVMLARQGRAGLVCLTDVSREAGCAATLAIMAFPPAQSARKAPV